MSAVTLNNENKLVDSIEKKIPDLYFMILIDKGGSLLSYFVSEGCSGECNLSKLKEIAKLVSIRFPIGGFDKLAGGLDLTINLFKERLVMTREIFQDNLMVIAMARNTDNLVDRTKAVLDITEIGIGLDLKAKSETELVKVSSETTDFQQTTNRLQPKIYTIVSSPVNSGSFYPASKAYLNLKLGKKYPNVNFETAKND